MDDTQECHEAVEWCKGQIEKMKGIDDVGSQVLLFEACSHLEPSSNSQRRSRN